MNFSFRGSAQRDAGHPAETESLDTAGGDRRRVALLGGGGAAAVAVVGVMAFVLTQGGSSADVAVASPVAGARSAMTAPTDSATSSPTTSAPVRPVSGRDARDPFAPLAVERTTASTTAVATSATTADSTAATVDAPSVTRTSSTTADSVEATSQLPTQMPSTPVRVSTRPKKSRPSVSPVRVTVKDVAADNSGATITVDGKKYPAVVDKVFAERFRLVALNDGRCAVVRYRDKVPFDLCVGKTRVLG